MFIKGKYDGLIASGLNSMTSSLDLIYGIQDLKFEGMDKTLSAKQQSDF
jgi:hypothetical protein